MTSSLKPLTYLLERITTSLAYFSSRQASQVSQLQHRLTTELEAAYHYPSWLLKWPHHCQVPPDHTLSAPYSPVSMMRRARLCSELHPTASSAATTLSNSWCSRINFRCLHGLYGYHLEVVPLPHLILIADEISVMVRLESVFCLMRGSLAWLGPCFLISYGYFIWLFGYPSPVQAPSWSCCLVAFADFRLDYRSSLDLGVHAKTSFLAPLCQAADDSNADHLAREEDAPLSRSVGPLCCRCGLFSCPFDSGLQEDSPGLPGSIACSVPSSREFLSGSLSFSGEPGSPSALDQAHLALAGSCCLLLVVDAWDWVASVIVIDGQRAGLLGFQFEVFKICTDLGSILFSG